MFRSHNKSFSFYCSNEVGCRIYLARIRNGDFFVVLLLMVGFCFVVVFILLLLFSFPICKFLTL